MTPFSVSGVKSPDERFASAAEMLRYVESRPAKRRDRSLGTLRLPDGRRGAQSKHRP
jgi:hypothetical protein